MIEKVKKTILPLHPFDSVFNSGGGVMLGLRDEGEKRKRARDGWGGEKERVSTGTDPISLNIGLQISTEPRGILGCSS